MPDQQSSISPLSRFLLRSSGIILFLVLWEAASRLRWIDPYFLPRFSVVTVEIWRLIGDGSLISNLAISSARAIGGLAIACLVGLPLGFAFGRWFPATAAALDPLLRIMSQVNPFLVLMASTLILGFGETTKFAVIAWVSVWPLLFYTITAVRTVDPLQIKTARSLGISESGLLLKILIPAALPTIFTGLRISAGITFFILVAVEMLNASSGLGYFEHNSAMNFEIPAMYAGATVIVVLGFLLNRFLIALERSLFAWKAPVDFLLGTTIHPTTQRPLWRPGRFSIVAASLIIVVLLVGGSFEIKRVNTERANSLSGDEAGKHARHLGSEVGK
jgi:NitT/TauT family transport system permease protein